MLSDVPGATKLRREREITSDQVSVPRATSMRFIWFSPIMPFTIVWKRLNFMSGPHLVVNAYL